LNQFSRVKHERIYILKLSFFIEIICMKIVPGTIVN
jgi:hypothetical protein